MSRQYRFHQLDVFSAEAFLGNPLAVVHDADDLTWTQMAAFARWTNLSETTFLMRPGVPGADYRVRIFTPGGELPFAGHPTLGSARAWLAAGNTPQNAVEVVQECGIGLVRVQVAGDRLAFAAPPLRRSGILDEQLLMTIVAGLKISRSDIVMHQWVDNGPGWCAVMLRSAEQVLKLQPDMAMLRDLKLGVIGPLPAGREALFEVRAFVPGLGVSEDPVTGSLNAGLGVWLIRTGQAPPEFTVSQGQALQRRGLVHIERRGADIWIGGDAVIRIEGALHIP
ncbi:MAG: PhzF family phenazine biosynthesis protein [Gammaproteobacteria bacterium]|jgi:PhzF family phenazine biosynthesis protein|nr:PhzF family phenazine biosynthesis protein [Gammaproteobacteria bacterium]NCW21038.1 PhzF family phenazine biosynthesis protein [Gammaproteobacteria bacterium]NCW56912.1 PhzF family phenazine biosynthesis protein [Gammaproteobacteria bacterium]NDA42241.1 PhzF family phenazine biosynthesis protein [Gammaproteobacteria bacterium]NDB15577.1 PhzF family phenazine biosynthesis protein [Gammaproteobacteria bacterium]